MRRSVHAGRPERQDEQAALLAAVTAARGGSGSVVLVTGEAGIGKSSLIAVFIGRLGAGITVLVGACDDLLAPRALGPLRDAAHGTGGPLERALAGSPDAVFGALHAQLSAGPPTVLVVEDVQWADYATRCRHSRRR